MTADALLHFSEHRLQEVALAFMAVVYILRLRWMFSFKFGKERQAFTGKGSEDNRKRAIAYSMFNAAMPWAMESTRKNFLFWVQFILFHLGVTFAITLSFIIPYLPGLLEPTWVVRVFQAVIGAACLVGLARIVRRIARPYIRAISTPDDHFSLGLLTSWFFFGVLAAPNTPEVARWPLLVFFILTAFFLVYVPFSKISHYLYYPFGRFFLGRTMGHRGVFPLERGPKRAPAVNR
jgi:nitrate reductase gamma subunit